MPNQPYIDFVRDSTDVERAVVAYLQRWLPWYVGQIEEQTDGMSKGDHPKVKTWDLRADLRTFPEDRLPIVLAIGTGTSGKPEQHGRKPTIAPYGVGIVVVAQGQNPDNAKTNASVYGKAIKAALVQKPSLETDWIQAADWEGERPDRLPPQETRELATQTLAFTFWAKAVVNPTAGPGIYMSDPPPVEEVPTTPDPPKSTVQTTDVEVDSEGEQS